MFEEAQANMVKTEKSESSDRRNIFALGFVSFFTDMSSEMVFSILPSFLLGLPGANKAVLGLIEGTAEALSYALRAVSGVFSDKFRKRKLFILVGYSVSNFIKPFFAIARAPFDVFIIRVSDRVGKAIRTSPRDALLSESVSERRQGVAFGLHRTLDQAGAIVGPLIASAMLILLGLTFREVFWVSLVPGTIALFIILTVVKEKVGRSKGEFRFLVGVKSILKGDFSLLLLIVGVFSLGAFNFSFILLNAKEAGVADSLIPLVYAVVNIVHAAIAIPAGALSDRIGKEKVLVSGYIVFLLTSLSIFLFPANSFNAFSIAVLFGVYLGINETIQRAIIPGYVKSNLRGTAYGLYYLVVGSAFFISNVVVGQLWECFGSSMAVTYSVILSSFAIVGMFLFMLWRTRVKEDVG